MDKTMEYPVYIEKDSDSDYCVTVPDLPGCFSGGSSIDEALSNSEEAILTHIEGMILDNEVIPNPSNLEHLKSTIDKPNIMWSIVTVDIVCLSCFESGRGLFGNDGNESSEDSVTYKDQLKAKIDSKHTYQ